MSAMWKPKAKQASTNTTTAKPLPPPPTPSIHTEKTRASKSDKVMRNAWKSGSLVEIYSESQKKWKRGTITQIFNDKEGEWLVIKYDGSVKEIQRFNDSIRPILNKQKKNEEIIATTKSTKKRKSLGINEENGVSVKGPHGDISRDELSKIKLRNRRVCAVRGLPSFANESLLRMDEYYGQFKGIKTMVINKHNNNNKYNKDNDSISAFITFDNDESTLNAINFSNTCSFGDGRKLKAAFGIQYYCRKFVAKKKCQIKNCRYKHQWAELKDVITNDDIDDFGARECGLKLDVNNKKLMNLNDGKHGKIEGMINRKELQKLFDEKQQIKLENDELMILNNKQKEEYKKLENKYKTLMDEHNILKKKYNEQLQKTGYSTWNPMDVVNWIINLNKIRYNKYYDELKKNIINEGIDGHSLADLDKNDLHRLGITQFKDKNDIYNSIQQLIKTKH